MEAFSELLSLSVFVLSSKTRIRESRLGRLSQNRISASEGRNSYIPPNGIQNDYNIRVII